MTQPKNPAAVALGRLAKGRPKNYPPAEIERRRRHMERVNEMLRKRKLTKNSKTAGENSK